LLKNDTAMLYSTKNSVKEKISDQVQFNKKIAEMNVPLQILKNDDLLSRWIEKMNPKRSDLVYFFSLYEQFKSPK